MRAGQCCGSVKFWYGTGPADPYLWLTDPDSDLTPYYDPAIFAIESPETCKVATRKKIFLRFFLLITFWSYIYIIFQRQKVKKSYKTVGFKVFLNIFPWWMMIEGSGSGSVLCTYWSGTLADLRHSMLRWMKMGPRMGSEFWLGRAKGSPGIGIIHSCRGDSAHLTLYIRLFYICLTKKKLKKKTGDFSVEVHHSSQRRNKWHFLFKMLKRDFHRNLIKWWAQ